MCQPHPVVRARRAPYQEQQKNLRTREPLGATRDDAGRNEGPSWAEGLARPSSCNQRAVIHQFNPATSAKGQAIRQQARLRIVLRRAGMNHRLDSPMTQFARGQGLSNRGQVGESLNGGDAAQVPKSVIPKDLLEETRPRLSLTKDILTYSRARDPVLSEDFSEHEQ